MKHTTAVIAALALGASAHASVVVQYSFEGNLNDTAAGGGNADNLNYVQNASSSAVPTYTPGVPGLPGSQAAVFDGNYFNAPTSADLNLLGTDWTIEAFVSAGVLNAEWHRLILVWDTQLDYHFALRNGNFDFFEGTGVTEVFQANTVPTPVNFADGAWHHLAVTSSAAGSQAWIDGISVFTGGPINLTSTSDNLGIGENSGGTFPYGRARWPLPCSSCF